MADLAKLVVSLEAQTQKYMTELDRANKRLGRFEQAQRRSLDKIKQGFAALAAGVSFGVVAQSAARAVRELENVQRTALALSTSVETVQELNFAFARFDLQSDDVADALNTLADRAQDAIDGTKSMVEDFRLLGVSVDDLRGKRPTELFRLLAERVARVEDPTQRAAGVVRTFGDDLGRRLLPFLIQGADGLERLREEARRAGAVLDEETVVAAADAAAEFRKLRETVDAQLAAAVANNADQLMVMADALGTVASSAVTAVGALGRFGELLGDALHTYVTGVDDVGQQNALEKELARLQELNAQARALKSLMQEPASDGSGALAQFEADSAALMQFIDKQREAEAAISGLSQSGPDGSGALAQFEAASTELRQFIDLQRQADTVIRGLMTVQEAAAASAQQDYAILNEAVQAGVISQDQYRDAVLRTAAAYEETLNQARSLTDQMSEFSREAARNMQDAFAQFLFDPFDDGLSGMLDSFDKILQQMVAEAAAAKIFDFLGQKGGAAKGQAGTGDILSGVLNLAGDLFGFANGGAFTVGGGGGIDSQLVAFKATPGERVSIETPAQQGQGGGRPIVVQMNIQTPDANSFQRSQGQIMQRAQASLARAARRNG